MKLRVGKKASPQPQQTGDSIGTKFRVLVVHPVYLLTTRVT